MNNSVIKLITGYTQRTADHYPAERYYRSLARTAPDIDNHASGGLFRAPAPIAAAIGSSIR